MRKQSVSKLGEIAQNKINFQQQKQILGEICEVQPPLHSHRQLQQTSNLPLRSSNKKGVLKQVRSATRLQPNSKLPTRKLTSQKSTSSIENKQLNSNLSTNTNSYGQLLSSRTNAAGGKNTPSHQAMLLPLSALPPSGARSPRQLLSQPLRTLKRGLIRRPDFDEAENHDLIYSGSHSSLLQQNSQINLIRKEKPRKKQQNLIQTLSYDLITVILEYVGSEDILRKAQCLSLFFYRTCQRQILWSRISSKNIFVEMRKLRILCERRSKGKLYLCESRLTGKRYTVRRVTLNVANAGIDDGVPMSILREYNNCQALQDYNCEKSANIHFVSQIEVSSTEVAIAQPFIPQNLREFIKANQIKKTCQSALLCKLRSNKSFMGLQLEQLKSTFKGLVSAIVHCHRNSVFHRNVKPDNVMVTSDGVIQLSDFALSRFEIAGSGQICTPEDPKERDRSGREARRLWYRAPELLLRKKHYSKEIDLWSLGCILAEMAIGDSLFKGQSEIEQLFLIYAMTGSPDVETLYQISNGDTKFKIAALPNWQRVNFTDICQKDTAVGLVSEMVHPMRKLCLEKLLQLSEQIGKDGLDLLAGLLELNPQKRMTAEQALSHPFLNSDLLPIDQAQNPNNYSRNQFLCHLSASPIADPLSNHSQITPRMRQILVDWLVDVSEHFEQKSSTLHFAIELLDYYLSKESDSQLKSELQLLGTCCLKICDQFNERSREYYRQDNASDYAHITADEYTSNQIVACEKRILKVTGFKILQASSHQWSNSILENTNWSACLSSAGGEEQWQHDQDGLKQTVKTCADMLADWSLLGQDIRANFTRQTIGQASVILACSVCQTPSPRLYGDIAAIKNCIKALRDLWNDCTTEGSHNARFISVKKKYFKYALPKCPDFTHFCDFSNIYSEGESMQID